MEEKHLAPLLDGQHVVIFGILTVILAFVFTTSSSESPIWKGFYTYVPPILLCYFLPAILHIPFIPTEEGYVALMGDLYGEPGGELRKYVGGGGALYHVASRYLLPASLILLCLNIDIKGLLNLGPKSLVMFLAATTGIVLGGPIAILTVGSFLDLGQGGEGEELWRGMSTIAGSWIGGGANQAAMKEIYEVSEQLFSAMVVVDVIVANIWMGFLLYGANISKKVDGWLKADSSAIDDLKKKMEAYVATVARQPTTADYFAILGVGFGGTALAHLLANGISPFFAQYKAELAAYGLTSIASQFFWLIVVATTLGFGLSFTRFRSLEGAGASKIGSVFIYLLVAVIGLHMDIAEAVSNPGYFLLGLVWMAVHVSVLLLTAKLIRAPFFFVAVGSQANVGGAASAPVVASAFSPTLAPVGALMAVLGYALGTYGAIVCALLMQAVSS